MEKVRKADCLLSNLKSEGEESGNGLWQVEEKEEVFVYSPDFYA